MIDRQRLVEPIIGAGSGSDGSARLWLVEAPGGYGKTVLAGQVRSAAPGDFAAIWSSSGAQDAAAFVASLAHALQAARLAVAGELMGSAEPNAASVAAALGQLDNCVIVVDRLDDWAPEVATLVAEVMNIGSAGVTLIVMGRDLGGDLQALRNRPDVGWIGMDALTLQTDEMSALIEASWTDAEQPSSDVLDDITGGWPIAAHAVVQQLAAASNWQVEAGLLASKRDVLGHVLDQYLNNLEPTDLAATAEAATFPFVDDRIEQIVGRPGLAGRLIAQGLPVSRRFDGRWEMPGHVRDVLLDRRTAPVTVNREVVWYLVERKEMQAAIDYCLSGAERSLAAEVIASLSISDEVLLDATTVNLTMDAIGSAVEQHPRSLLVQARRNLSASSFEKASQNLHTAEELFARIDPDMRQEAHVEVVLEQGIACALTGQLKDAEERLMRCEDVVGDQASPSRAMLFELRAAVGGLRDLTPAGQAQNEADLLTALDLWHQVGEGRGAAAVIFRLAGDCLLRQGEYQRCLELLDQARKLRPLSVFYRARISLISGMVLPYLGRSAEALAELEEAARLADTLGQSWLGAWAHWNMGILASLTGDEEQLAESMRMATRLDEGVISSPVWAEQHADAVHAWGRCGNQVKAQEHLECIAAIEEVADEPNWSSTFARWCFRARFGDPNTALDEVEGLRIRDDVPGRDRWLLWLMTAEAFRRAGDGERCEEASERAAQEAAAIGSPALPRIVEGRLIADLEESANSAEVRDADPGDAEPGDAVAAAPTTLEITVLGDFRVERNGVVLDVPGGQVSVLLKLMTLAQRAVHIEQVIDAMWPDADVQTGRKRLRNVLMRARATAGDIVHRNEETLVFSDGVGSDLWRAREAVQRLAKNPEATMGDCDAVLDLLAPQLLPSDVYDDRASEERALLLSHTLDALDRRAELALAAGQGEVAAQTLREAAGLDPLPNDRLRRSAQILHSIGRHGAASEIEASGST